MKLKKVLTLALALALALSLAAGAASCSAETEERATLRLGSLKGPTSMGLYTVLTGDNAQYYQSEIVATADELAPKLISGELDAALVPCNLASVLYNKTGGGLKVAFINTLGVLYVLERGESVNEIADLEGRTIYSTGKNTTPEYAFSYVLEKSGVKANVEYKSESTEVASALLAGGVDLAMLPQPYVTTVLMKDEGVRVALSLTEEWDKVSPESALVTGVAVIRSDFIEQHPDEAAQFIADCAASAEYVNANPAEAAAWIAEVGIVASAAVAEKALPECNIVCLAGEEMKAKVSGYLQALFDKNPASVGGALPGDDFYYGLATE